MHSVMQCIAMCEVIILVAMVQDQLLSQLAKKLKPLRPFPYEVHEEGL